jgi:hypothetical protein
METGELVILCHHTNQGAKESLLRRDDLLTNHIGRIYVTYFSVTKVEKSARFSCGGFTEHAPIIYSFL